MISNYRSIITNGLLFHYDKKNRKNKRKREIPTFSENIYEISIDGWVDVKQDKQTLVDLGEFFSISFGSNLPDSFGIISHKKAKGHLTFQFRNDQDNFIIIEKPVNFINKFKWLYFCVSFKYLYGVKIHINNQLMQEVLTDFNPIEVHKETQLNLNKDFSDFDVIRIYNRQLSNSESLQNFKVLKERYYPGG